MFSLKLILYSLITIWFNGAVLRRYLKEELLLSGPYALFILLPTLAQPLCQLLLGGFCGITLFAIASYQIYKRLPQQFLDVRNRAVFITGCDSGLGHAMAKDLDQKGVTVFAGILKKGGDGEKELKNACSEKLTTIPIDITKDGDVDAAAQYIRQNLNGKDLWAVVNNAGICHFCEQDFFPMEEFDLHMQVNYLGTVRVTKAFMPLLKKSRGRLVCVTSIACYGTTRLLSAYSPSKAAVQSFIDSYRFELQQWDVKAICIQPSGFNTGFFRNDFPRQYLRENILPKTSDAIKEEYGEEYIDSMIKTLAPSNDALIPSDFSPVTRAVDHALFSKSPLENYPAGTMAETGIFMTMLLPPSFVRILFSVLGALPPLPVPAYLRNQKEARKEDGGSSNVVKKEDGVQEEVKGQGENLKED